MCLDFMPVQKAGPDVRQNPIRFKNLIREAEERLNAMEIRHTEAVFFKPLMNLILLSSGETKTTDWQSYISRSVSLLPSSD